MRMGRTIWEDNNKARHERARESGKLMNQNVCVYVSFYLSLPEKFSSILSTLVLTLYLHSHTLCFSRRVYSFSFPLLSLRYVIVVTLVSIFTLAASLNCVLLPLVASAQTHLVCSLFINHSKLIKQCSELCEHFSLALLSQMFFFLSLWL